MKKVRASVFLIFVLNASTVFSQISDPRSFYPHHKGDIWQYRSMFTNELIRTVHIDSVGTDTVSENIFIYRRTVTAGTSYSIYRIDSSDNLYNMNFNPEFPRYKLYADSGETWIAGFTNDSIPVVVTVSNIYERVILGINTIVKAFRFEVQYPPPQEPFWIGTDHLADGLGLVQTDIEPSDIYYLSGALIDSRQHGTIVSANLETSPIKTFEVIKNYPNPFNNSTVISFTISDNSDVNITIYDLLGRAVKVLENEKKQKGTYEVNFEADEFPSGPYFVVLKTDSNLLTHKILLIK